MSYVTYLFLLIGLFVAAPCARAQAPVEAGASYRIQSQTLQEEREYTIRLPASYKWRASRRYPTLYLLDGKAHFLHAAGSVGILSAAGEIPEMIVVAVSSSVRVRDFTQSDWPEAWIGGGGAGKFRQFLAAELIPHIEARYRTDGFRVLTGHSASAQFALHDLATSPNNFRGYIALAPSLDWDKRLPARELESSLRSRTDARAFLYFAYADDFGEALADDRHLESVLTRAPPSLRWQARAYPDETHASLPLLGHIDGLRALYAGYRYHNDWMERGVGAAERHYHDVSERLGWPTPLPEDVMNRLGYAAMGDGRMDDAIEIFERNAAAHPDSANVFDSLSEAYAKAARPQDAGRAAGVAAWIARDPAHPNHTHYVERARELGVPAAAAE